VVKSSWWVVVVAVASGACASAGGSRDSGRVAAAPDRARLAASPARIVSAETETVGLGVVTYAVEVEVRNDGATPAATEGLTLALTSGGRTLARRTFDASASVAVGASARLVERWSVDTAQLTSKDRELRPGVVVPCVLEAVVALRGPRGLQDAPASARVDLPLPTPPRLEARTLRCAADGDRVRGTVRFDLQNPNVFPLDAERFSFSLRLGGAEVAVEADTPPSLPPQGAAPWDVAFEAARSDARWAEGTAPGVAFLLDGTLLAFSPFGVLVFPTGASGAIEISR